MGLSIPKTVINWHDESDINTQIENVILKPLQLQAFSSDKGPEKMMVVEGDDFFKLYGSKISFEKHGQPLLQAANIINGGGKLLAKRVVAPDATLANVGIVAELSTIEIQKQDEDGHKLYIDQSGNETITITDTPATYNTAVIKFDAVSAEGVKTLQEAKVEIGKYFDDDGIDADEALQSYTLDDGVAPRASITTIASGTDSSAVGFAAVDKGRVGMFGVGIPVGKICRYPLFVITDNGRGESSKRIKITTDYNLNKGINFAAYSLYNIGEGDIDSEYQRFSIDPDIIYLNNSMSLSMTEKGFTQLRANGFDDSCKAFIKKISEITGISEDELSTYDLLFGKDKRGNALEQIVVDPAGYQLDNEYGILLQSGSNGSFGDTPFGCDTYNEELLKFFKGEFDDSIFDLDRYKIDNCFDANYPIEVKKAICDLADWREDFFFFRDIGLGHDTFDTITLTAAELPASKFYGTYIQSFDIVDPYSKKQIPVTITYSLARLAIRHFIETRNAPFCGFLYGIQFPEAIEGTINFIPKTTPTVDQKTELADLSLNYASIINDVLTMETEFTSLENPTQLSYINNIVAVQAMIHDIRDNCPKLRYSFITNDDLDNYQSDVEAVISRYTDYFDSLEFSYTQDEMMAVNKIFNATIKVRFKNFVQTEIFDIYTLGAASTN